MNAVPLSLKRAIGVGHRALHPVHRLRQRRPDQVGRRRARAARHGRPSRPSRPVRLPGRPAHHDRALRAARSRRRSIISILVTTVIALARRRGEDPGQRPCSRRRSSTRSASSTSGRSSAMLPVVTALLTIFAIMLTDFFDTMGTVTGVAAEAGLAEPDGSVPGVGRVAARGQPWRRLPAAPRASSSNTTYIESAAGVADGGRTGFDVGRDRRALPARHPAVADRADRPDRRRRRRPWCSSAT